MQRERPIIINGIILSNINTDSGENIMENNFVEKDGVKKPGKARGFATWLIIALSLFYIVSYLALAGARIQYPYELAYTEGANAAEMAQVAAGKPAYVVPGIHYTPLVYTPLNFYIAAITNKINPGDYFGLRFNAIMGTIITTLLIILIAMKARAPLWVIAASAGTFLGAFTRCGFVQDTGHTDSLSIAFAMCALALLFEYRKSVILAAIAGLIAGIAFLTKQTMIVFIGIPFLWLMFKREWARALVFSFMSLVSILAIMAWLGLLSNHWFYYFVFGVESNSYIDPVKVLFAAPIYLIFMLPAGILIGLLGNSKGVQSWREMPRRWYNDPWAVTLLAYIGLALLAKAKVGGGENVFLPVVAIGAVQIGRYAGELVKVRPRQILALIIFQLIVIYYPPTLLWPTQADRDAGDRLVEMIKKVPGDVYIPAFPEYAVRAGKPWYAHYTVSCGNLEYNQTLRKELGEMIRNQKFGAVIPRLDIEPLDRGWCEVPYLDEYYEPGEDVIMPPRPSGMDILTGRPSLSGIAHGGKFSKIYYPRKNVIQKTQ